MQVYNNLPLLILVWGVWLDDRDASVKEGWYAAIMKIDFSEYRKKLI